MAISPPKKRKFQFKHHISLFHCFGRDFFVTLFGRNQSKNYHVYWNVKLNVQLKVLNWHWNITLYGKKRILEIYFKPENTQTKYPYRNSNYDNYDKSPKNSPYWVKQKVKKIVTQIVTKCVDLFITSILANSGRSTKKSPYWVKQKVTKSSHELSQISVIISSPQFSKSSHGFSPNTVIFSSPWLSPIQAIHRNCHQIGWQSSHIFHRKCLRAPTSY